MFALLMLLQSQAPPAPRAIDDWRVRVTSTDTTSLTGMGRGSPLAPAGAELSLHSVRTPPPGSWSTVVGMMPADSMLNRLVTLTGDVSTVDVAESAVLWLRVDGPQGSLSFKNTTDQAVSGTSAARPVSVTLRVDPGAVAIFYGVVLSGAGAVQVQHLRVTSAPAPSGPPSAEAKRVLDAAFSAVKSGSYWRDTVTWSVVEPEFWARAEGARTTDEAYPAIQYLLSRLGDHHSTAMPPSAVKAMSAPLSADGTLPPGSVPEVKTLDGGIGYVLVPAFANPDSEVGAEFSVTIQSGLLRAAPAAACGWIVDLRTNGGGNMWPMLAGLKPFLGSGPLGSFQTPDGKRVNPWIARSSDMPPALAVLESAPVAVLTGPITASSGEAVTIAFRGRPRTRSFGQPTRGLANANSTIRLPDGGLIALMTSVDVDRDGKVYGYKVDPDVIVPEGAEGEDAALALASRWLEAESKCR